MNAKMIMGAIEFVKKAYDPAPVAENEHLGHLLALARNVGIDLIESSDLLKFNFMNFASGNVMHPGHYEWQDYKPQNWIKTTPNNEKVKIKNNHSFVNLNI